MGDPNGGTVATQRALLRNVKEIEAESCARKNSATNINDSGPKYCRTAAHSTKTKPAVCTCRRTPNGSILNKRRGLHLASRILSPTLVCRIKLWRNTRSGPC